MNIFVHFKVYNRGGKKMQNKFIEKAAVVIIVSLLFIVALAPSISSSSVKNIEFEKNNVFDPVTMLNNEITYDVYFSTTSPPPKVVSNQSETTYNPGILEYNTTYYWQIVAWNDQNESAEGPIWHFTTEIGSPSVETLNADPLGKTNATLNGKILEDGGESCKVRFRYREMGQTDWIYPSEWHGLYVTNETFSEYIDGLNLSTLYEFQAGAKNSKDEQWGDIKNFTTNENQLPVAIIIAPSTGNKKVDITFDGSSSYDPDGYIVEYYWAFSDGGTGNGSIITHQFQQSGTYQATLLVEDNNGGTNGASHQITIINHAPVASFVADQYYIEPGDTVTFDGTGSYDPDGDSLTYEWKLGDGTVIGTDAIITYTFYTSGTFTIILTVCDDDQANQMCNTVTDTIYVNSPPIADFTQDPEDPIWIGTTVEFDGSISYDPDGYIVNWTWYFGDTGEYAYGIIVTHAFYLGGDWTVTLIVTDDFGSTDDHSEIITVWYPLGCSKSSKEIQISPIHVDTNGNTELIMTKETSGGYPPRIPSDPYPEDGATDVPIDVVLSWIGGENTPPNAPIINGPTRGRPGVTYYYNFTIDDDDGDPLLLWIDWGDGTHEEWVGPYEPGQNITVGHAWALGTFVIRARTRDIYGTESEWGELMIAITKSKVMNRPFLKFLQNHPYLFQILKQLLGL
jgi:chitodextrinase